MDFEARNIIKVQDTSKHGFEDFIVIEEPLKIVVDDSDFATIMRTPGSDRELVVGFMFSEGLIKDIDAIQMIAHKGVDSENSVKLKLKDAIKTGIKDRSYEIRSSCGICGQKKIDILIDEAGSLKRSFKVRCGDIFKMPDLMGEAQVLSKRTRGAHAAAFFTKDAKLVACFEDVGRHNALDKLIGHSLINGIAMDDKVLLLSGRTSYEMMAKALRCKIGFVASISAPSSMAVEIAIRGNIALVGVLRGETMKIYSGSQEFI